MLFIIRLFHITYPPLETAHSWRQSDVLMVARNFYESSPNILYPRIDYGGNSSGITGMEFPIFNYLIYLLSIVFGYNHFYGRIINLTISTFGCYYFYKILKEYFSEKTAFYSTIILMSSLWFAYSRKAMPDIFATSLVLIGLYYGFQYLFNSSHWYQLAFYFILVSFGILSKISAGYLMALLLFPLMNNEVRLRKKIILTTLSAISLSAIVVWYFIWVPHLTKLTPLNSFFMGVSFTEGINGLFLNFNDTMEKFYFTAMGFSGCCIFITGLYYSIKKKNKAVLSIFCLLTIAFAIFMFKMGRNFSIHTYYILVFIPVMAFLAGYAINNIKQHWLRVLLLMVIFLENVGNQWTDFSPRKERMEMIRLEEIIDSNTESEDLIAINMIDPIGLYMAHRKGWKLEDYQLIDPIYLADIRKEGCKFLVVIQFENKGNINLNFPVLFEDDFFRLYQL